MPTSSFPFLGSGPGGADALLNRGKNSVRPYVPPPKSQIERSLGLRLGSLGLNWGSLDLIRGPLL